MLEKNLPRTAGKTGAGGCKNGILWRAVFACGRRDKNLHDARKKISETIHKISIWWGDMTSLAGGEARDSSSVARRAKEEANGDT